ncbi:ribosome small subunit-dependent GTPase A [Cognatiluteimonas profundi]|uniref:ribosome small subunit-dependent GTPase A n=1 Tax=Cognatiluteimonas profundi TaxID=2594501 RepID=UPI001E31AE5E|nr:ribosome small subunit-dependent GTPase A [Lysobacter profundi]
MTPLRAIGWPHAGPVTDPQWMAVLAAHPQARPARVVEQHRSGYIVAEGPGEGYATQSPPEWQRAPSYKQGALPSEGRAAVGDWVLVEGEGGIHGRRRSQIVALLPRYSAIKRAAAGEHYKQQVIAANIDTVFVVCGLDGDFNPRRIERYLLLVQGSGCTPVVVLTKADTVDDMAAALDALVGSVGEAVAVVPVNARDPASVDALLPWLKPGSTAVLVGSSGAGKSTLTNTLLGTDRMKTAAVRENDARGRHTTTHRALLPLLTGACLIDTPGMRELKPTGEEDVAENFADIDALADQCKFRDCRHQGEPGCAVRAAIDAGSLAAQRYAHYLKLGDEVAEAATKLATRLAQKAEQATGKPSPKRSEPRNGRR